MTRFMKPLLTLIALGAATSLSRSQLSPVTRVVELLDSMRVRLEQDHKAEEDLYETFVCWAKSIISQKTKSNVDAQARMDYLTTYVSDLNNGRIELTTERVDLEKEIESLTGDLEVAAQVRQQEAKDFEMAKEQMDQAINALTKAIEVLKTATQGHEDGVLLGLRGSLSEGYTARAKEGVALNKAVELGSRVLTKGDAVFLQRLLTGEVPDRASWKKLNRKATFKMDYKARSFKIQGVLARLLENFASDSREAAAKEIDAIKTHEILASAKKSEKTTAQAALSKMEKENGARGLSLEECNDELKGLTTEFNNDKVYISQVQQALETKKAEWKTRQTLRAGEQEAISKAISILRSGDNRDLFKRSFASQGLLFLQEGSQRSWAKRVTVVEDLLRKAAHTSGDQRLLASNLRQGHFVEVIKAIDDMLVVLRAEESSDLKHKEDCESDRATDTREAIKTSRQMDDLTDVINSLEAKIAELESEIKHKTEQVEEIDSELKEISEMRTKENSEYVIAKKDDQDAAALVKSAQQEISKFYTENNLVLVQDQQHEMQPVAIAGEAPPPPPPTWKAPYGGRTDESTGIIAIMDMIHDDILKDVAKAEADEQAAVVLYTKTKTNLEEQKNLLEQEISDHKIDKGAKEADVVSNSADRSIKHGELGVVMGKISSAEAGCDFIAINFLLRSNNRKVEIDGLTKAKAILKGGKFDGLPDPDREMQPGDALVQSQAHSGRKFLSRSFG